MGWTVSGKDGSTARGEPSGRAWLPPSPVSGRLVNA
jgi:hypothetical protein